MIHSLRRDASQLRSDANLHLAGRFPLIRAFGLDLTDEDDDPVTSQKQPLLARRTAVHEALRKLGSTASSDPLLAVVLAPESTLSTPGLPLADIANAQAQAALASLSNVTIVPEVLERNWITSRPGMAPARCRFSPIVRSIEKAVTSERHLGGIH